jgi:hypothetical protein
MMNSALHHLTQRIQRCRTSRCADVGQLLNCGFRDFSRGHALEIATSSHSATLQGLYRTINRLSIALSSLTVGEYAVAGFADKHGR